MKFTMLSRNALLSFCYFIQNTLYPQRLKVPGPGYLEMETED